MTRSMVVRVVGVGVVTTLCWAGFCYAAPRAIPISKNKGTLISGLPDVLNRTVTIRISAGTSPGTIKITTKIPPKTQFTSGGFTMESGDEGSELEKTSRADEPVTVDSEFIVLAPNVRIRVGEGQSLRSGTGGAKLRRVDGKTVVLTQGSAFLSAQ